MRVGRGGMARLRLVRSRAAARIFAVLPPDAPCGPEMESLLSTLEELRGGGLTGISTHSIDVHSLPDAFARSLEPGGNVYNARSFACHAGRGLERVCLSHEVDGEDALSVLDAASEYTRAEITLYGRVGAMFTRVCPVAGNACKDPEHGICLGKSFTLRDDRGRKFPVVCHPGPCTADILSSVPVERFDLLERLSQSVLSDGTSAMAHTAWRFSFYDEPQAMRVEWIARLRRILADTMAGTLDIAEIQRIRNQIVNR